MWPWLVIGILLMVQRSGQPVKLGSLSRYLRRVLSKIRCSAGIFEVSTVLTIDILSKWSSSHTSWAGTPLENEDFGTWNFGSRRWCLNSCWTEEIHQSSYDFFVIGDFLKNHFEPVDIYKAVMTLSEILAPLIICFREKILNCTNLHMQSLGPSWLDEIEKPPGQ